MDDRRRKFETLALPHLDAAYNLARWLSRSGADAEDVVQEAMLRAFRGFDGFRGTDVKPWLLAIVRNCHLTRVADRGKRSFVPLEDEQDGLASDQPNPETQALQRAEARRLNNALAGLPDEFREVLVMREMEDMSYREIAEVTGAPIGTVMSRLSRARALLRERLQEGYSS